jgi:hypothetical protein
LGCSLARNRPSSLREPMRQSVGVGVLDRQPSNGSVPITRPPTPTHLPHTQNRQTDRQQDRQTPHPTSPQSTVQRTINMGRPWSMTVNMSMGQRTPHSTGNPPGPEFRTTWGRGIGVCDIHHSSRDDGNNIPLSTSSGVGHSVPGWLPVCVCVCVCVCVPP